MQEALLIMEAKGLAPQVRSSNFSNQWSRLYRAGTLMVDLSCQPEIKQTLLQGQILADETISASGHIVLLNAKTQEKLEAQLDCFHQFKLAVQEPGTFQLELEVGQHYIKIAELHIN